MSVFEHILDESEEYIRIRAATEKGVSPIHVSGVMDAQKAHLIYTLSHSLKGVFIVTANEMTARRLESDYRTLSKSCVRISEKELSLRKYDAEGKDILFSKLTSLDEIQNASCVIASVGALLQLVTPKKKFCEGMITLKVGSEIALSELSEKLVAIGYSRCDTVEGRGQFSIRGGIVDIFSPDAENPIRMEFFGDEVDSLRSFDVMSQISIDREESVRLIPAGEIEETGSLLEYIPSDFTVFYDEPQRIGEQAEAIRLDVEERLKTLAENGNLDPSKEKYINTYAELLPEILRHDIVSLATLSVKTPDFRPKELFSMTVKSMQTYGGKIDALIEDILYYQQRKFRVIVAAGPEERVKSLCEIFADKGINITTDTEDPLIGGITLLMRGSFSGGFEYPLIKTVVISDRDLMPKEHQKRRKRVPKGSEITSYAELVPGDYVVHEVHGIGRFTGMERISAAGSIKDYLKLVYKGDDVLYVPVGQLDMLHKYKSGVESSEDNAKRVKLNKLGGAEWRSTKSSVKKNVMELAEKLVKLYAERSEAKGHMFPEDTPWQREFESEFIYEETDDQLRSIEEMKEDMQSAKPMDRLLCGDVGFGKTEVAMRGAFKCVTDGMQVAYLVPTTVLASQQYSNFLQRMKNYPITVEMLSRFRSKKAQAEIVKKVRTGEVDILIGTHRILQKDILFKNLGMLIIDEEQRFGVAHKEAIKQLKNNVDVLTLSATPIPRSLNMAMIGIRDMSLLTAPPQDRIPVQTFAMEYSEAVIREAITRELSRGGQVYYLFNRVSGIYKVAERIREMFPEASVAVGHGQMNEGELEKIMLSMVEGEIDILVCTTIIETGLDISNVNTIIIEDADKMGLSQLYQLRGRVGRSARLAYAYLTYKRDKVISEVAEKRLKAIKEFTEFGSGFRIAMRDLELRGAGNVLGPEQSGFMATVGYEVYCQLLSEAVAQVRGEAPKEKAECLVDIDVNAYIPESYIESSTTRIQIYKKIAGIEDISDCYAVEEELEDRFGDIPSAVSRLIDASMIRSEARKEGIVEINQKNDRIMFFVSNEMQDIPGKISTLNTFMRGKVMFSNTGRQCIYIRYEKTTAEATIEFVKKVLQNLKCKE